MPYIDLTPVTISASVSGTWTQLNSIIQEDNIYTVHASATTGFLYAEFYTPPHTNPLVPPDTVINGIQVFYTARVSGASGVTLQFNYYTNSSRTLVASSISSVALTNTEVASSVGSSTNTFSFPIQWVDLNSLQNGRQIGNPWFGVAVKPASAHSSPIWIDSMYVRVHYTSYNYLVGSRNKFKLNRPDLGYDTDISNKGNGIAVENQIKSSDVNLLGDSLYSIESAILSSTGMVYSVDLNKTYVFAITVSANCNSVDSLQTNAVIYGKIAKGNNTYSSSYNIVNPYRTSVPNIPNSILCDWTSAIGWVQDGTGRTYHLYTSAQGARFAKTSTGIDFVVGVTAIGSGLGTASDYDSYANSANAYQGYIGSYFTTAPASGRLFLKIFAMGREL